jgi:flagellar basal-body rod protein FlgG
MFQGYYDTFSGMLTQVRNLDVISNNIANITTAGYKKDVLVTSTFGEAMVYQSNGLSTMKQVGTMSAGTTIAHIYADYDPEGYVTTANSLDLAIVNEGFFCIQGASGTVYTRNGSFSLDEQGYLCLQDMGRVLGTNGPILLGTDEVTIDGDGNIYRDDNGQFLGQLEIVDFEDKGNLINPSGSVYISDVQGNAINARVQQFALEQSNVNPVDEMTKMMSSQRTFQSCAQILKMYDELTGKVVTSLGPI